MADESTLYGRGRRSLPRRQRNPPSYLCDYELEEKAEEDEIEISKVEEEVMYEVEDVMERRDNEVLVKWRGYGPEHNSWVNLANNRELSGWLQKHASHPQSSTLAKESISSLDSLERELWFVKNLVFDELNLRHTSEGDEGVLGRVQVIAPFSNEAFVHYFGKGTFPLAKERGLDFSGTENVKFTATVAEVGSVLGADWKARCFSNSSTVCEVDPSSAVYVQWGYEHRRSYDHSVCPRCSYTGEELGRPATCQPRETAVPSASTLKLSFGRRRRNLLAAAQ